MHLGDIDRIRTVIAALDAKLREAPLPTDKNEVDALYTSWTSAMLSATALRDREGDTESLMTTLAALYRIGWKLDVDGCRARAEEIVPLALDMYPDSMQINWQAVYLYSMTDSGEFRGRLEGALLRLRWLLGSDDNFEVEKRLAALYVREDADVPDAQRHARARKQIAHCRELRPEDASVKALETAFAKIPVPPESDE